jgi:DNA helicase II / ATP-dependent DNA helicase PcrA
MAERSKLEPEVQEIFLHIDKGDNFLLSGGAGSGKTYSLVQVIKQVISENATSKIACVTYTNAAVREIGERVNHKNLNVSTIHDFLWDNIKHFQKELKCSLIALINDDQVSKIKNPEDTSISEIYFDALIEGIQYKEYLKLKDGIVSHDEVLILAKHMFKTYPKLCDILKDKFAFIFIDEYQDTQKEVVEIFLEHLRQSQKRSIIGFFGDSMQSIYPDGVGDLNLHKGIEKGKVKEVKKTQNRRNPRLIMELANKLRTDGLIQTPSFDLGAPNMIDGKIKEGNIKFYYSANNDLDEVKKMIGWNFEDAKKTKILNLTHNLIAPKAGFSNLMEIYDGDKIISYKDRVKKYIKDKNIDTDFSAKTFKEVISILEEGKTETELRPIRPTPLMQEFINANGALYELAKKINYQIISKIYLDKDSLIDDKKQDADDENKKGSKRDDLIKHLFKIQNNIMLYKTEQYNEFIRTTEYKISSIADKKKLKETIQELSDNVGDKPIEEVINAADKCGICRKDDNLSRFMSEKEYVYNRVKMIKYSEFQNIYNYLEGYTPFSTQHKTKGTEFDNVLVVLDNGRWNDYNFEYLFNPEGSLQELESNKSKNRSKIESHPKILLRSQKIFYVCCTRAKENLAVFFNNPSDAVINKAKDWFAADNVCEI